jgi:CHAT domain-containing protein
VHWRPEDLGATVEGYRMALQDVRRTDHWVTGQILYDSLVAPLKRWTEGKRLIIVPSGRLNTLPFGALSSNRRYLLEECDLSVIPNVSTLQFVRTPKRVSSRSSVLAVGNPHNPHVSRLPGAEQEVMAIRSVFEGASVFVGDAASESKVREAMGSYDVVHVACHGLFNYEYPILSSLALTPDAENDGFLQVHELYNLNLLRTSLVVLSACETGLSQIKKNDDMIGFIRGFFYAGVPSTVASLWKVDDRATSSLMSNFHLLLKLGNSKSQALRKSQMQLMRAESTSHPFYWAAFVLYGNPE